MVTIRVLTSRGFNSDDFFGPKDGEVIDHDLHSTQMTVSLQDFRREQVFGRADIATLALTFDIPTRPVDYTGHLSQIIARSSSGTDLASLIFSDPVSIHWDSNLNFLFNEGLFSFANPDLPSIRLAGDDDMQGNANADVFSGYGGNDLLVGLGGNDLLVGGEGDDTLVAGDIAESSTTTFDRVLGGNGDDTLDASASERSFFFGGDGSDTLTFQAATHGVMFDYSEASFVSSIETIVGGMFADTLSGAGQADRLDGGAGADTLTGYSGDDTYVVDDAGDSVVEQIDAGTDLVRSTVDFTLPDTVENLVLTGTVATQGTGNDLDNRVTGNDAGDHLDGQAGADTLTGGLAADRLDGGAGNDLIAGGAGADGIDGGGDTDTLDYGTSAVAVIVDLAAGTGTGGDAQGDQITAVENLSGSARSDRLSGTAAMNTLSGGGGNDLLDGRDGKDVLIGGDGKDVLIGGLGRDILTGGLGADRFVLAARKESAPGSDRDIITDFDHAQSDRIDLSAIDANNKTSANDAFSFIGGNAFGQHAGELRFAYSGDAATIVEADIDGNGTADFQIQLTGHLAIVAGDFAL